MADRAGSSTTWLTCDEVAFVQGLGAYHDGAHKLPRLTWLQRYIETAEHRIEWGKIDKATVLREAKRLLRGETRFYRSALHYRDGGDRIRVKRRKGSRGKAA